MHFGFRPRKCAKETILLFPPSPYLGSNIDHRRRLDNVAIDIGRLLNKKSNMMEQNRLNRMLLFSRTFILLGLLPCCVVFYSLRLLFLFPPFFYNFGNLFHSFSLPKGRYCWLDAAEHCMRPGKPRDLPRPTAVPPSAFPAAARDRRL